jgi:hypothetical protein
MLNEDINGFGLDSFACKIIGWDTWWIGNGGKVLNMGKRIGLRCYIIDSISEL